jgi:hypothetical protein
MGYDNKYSKYIGSDIDLLSENIDILNANNSPIEIELFKNGQVKIDVKNETSNEQVLA